VIEDMLRRDKGFLRSAGWASLLALCASLGAEGTAKAKADKPAYVWLWYADGTPMPMDGLNCLGFKPPAFTCSYGATVEDCQRQVQTYLDAWYADFNIVFTLTRPANGEIFYPMVISADGSWCLQTQTEAGVAPNNNCIDTHALAAIAFECGKSAHACATIIAHEHGHLVGLEHTVSTTDVMNPIIQATTPGLETGKRGTVVTNEKQKTSREGIFAGGDLSRGGATVILAMKDGKTAAAAIHEYLNTVHTAA